MTTERTSLREQALAAFMEYFRTNYPGPDTIIGRPDWHAPKIFRAVEHALKDAGLIVSEKATITTVEIMGHPDKPVSARCILSGCQDFASSSETSLTTAAHDVLSERKRQVEVEGWDAEHDDEHWNGGLALAAACYASLAAVHAQNGTPLDVYAKAEPPFRWPWERRWWKPKDPRRDLIRAAALILAEIERIDRKAL